MSQPTAYSKTRNFAADESGAVGGRSTILTAGLDTELVNIQTTLTGVLSSLAKILRDDDLIKDNFVKPNGFGLADTDGYLQRKTGAWQVVADPTVAAATARDLAITARVAAEAARDLAQAYRDAAATSATNASNSASTATTQAGLATSNGAAQVALATTQANNAATSAAEAATQANNASTSATNAAVSETNAAAVAAGNIAASTHAATSKATPVDADELALVDSAAAWVLKKLTWANLKATLKTYLDTLYLTNTVAAIGDAIVGATAKTTPVDADVFALSDSAATDDLKKLSLANLKTAIFNSPALVTPNLGTPSAINLANATALALAAIADGLITTAKLATPLQIKVGSFAWTNTDASNTAYDVTGLGMTPIAIIFFTAQDSGQASWNFADNAITAKGIIQRGDVGADKNYSGGGTAFAIYGDSSNYVTGTLVSMSSGAFRLNIQKTGTGGTGVSNVQYLVIGR